MLRAARLFHVEHFVSRHRAYDGAVAMNLPLAHSSLFTDLYELTMAAAYLASAFETDDPRPALATFELVIRRLPEHRGYLLAAGLEQVLDFLEGFHFADEEIDFLRRQPVFESINRTFFDYLRGLRFTGEVW